MDRNKVLIIGFGSTVRGDDSFGPIVANKIKSYLDEIKAKKARVLICQTLTPELAHEISLSDFVLFVDASADGERGKVIESSVQSDPDAVLAMVHFLEPQALLNWSEQIYKKKAEASVLTVVGEDFSFAIETLTPKLEKLLPEVLGRAKEIIHARL